MTVPRLFPKLAAQVVLMEQVPVVVIAAVALIVVLAQDQFAAIQTRPCFAPMVPVFAGVAQHHRACNKRIKQPPKISG